MVLDRVNESEEQNDLPIDINPEVEYPRTYFSNSRHRSRRNAMYVLEDEEQENQEVPEIHDEAQYLDYVQQYLNTLRAQEDN